MGREDPSDFRYEDDEDSNEEDNIRYRMHFSSASLIHYLIGFVVLKSLYQIYITHRTNCYIARVRVSISRGAEAYDTVTFPLVYLLFRRRIHLVRTRI
jgi:hypothetical protein